MFLQLTMNNANMLKNTYDDLIMQYFVGNLGNHCAAAVRSLRF